MTRARGQGGRLSCNWLALRINDRICRAFPYAGRVVDLGCGEAAYRREILAAGATYVGVDWPRSAHPADAVDLHADLSRPFPLRDGCADTVVSFQTIEHIPEPSLYLAECLRILRPGGRLFLTAPFLWHAHEEPHDYYRFTRHGLAYLLRKAGFASVEVTENTGYWQTAVLLWTYHTERRAGPIRRLLLPPLWFLGQSIAPFLDRIAPDPAAAGSYTARATRP